MGGQEVVRITARRHTIRIERQIIGAIDHGCLYGGRSENLNGHIDTDSLELRLNNLCTGLQCSPFGVRHYVEREVLTTA